MIRCSLTRSLATEWKMNLKRTRRGIGISLEGYYKSPSERQGTKIRQWKGEMSKKKYESLELVNWIEFRLQLTEEIVMGSPRNRNKRKGSFCWPNSFQRNLQINHSRTPGETEFIFSCSPGVCLFLHDGCRYVFENLPVSIDSFCLF